MCIRDSYYMDNILTELKHKKSTFDISEWRMNELYSAGMTLLQFANGWKLSQLQTFHKDNIKGAAPGSIRFPGISKDISKIIAMMLEGASLFDIEREYETYSQDSKVQKLKADYEKQIADMTAKIHKQAEDEKTKSEQKIVESVSYTHLTLPTIYSV
eukprot:TRINITY_DN20364_c0_g1_i1.p1 TRINITY_DN20364_c0_g1~~TRINITY_DN20364_c0_g1_i1.p1  ORF type:complete len:176 (+),score=48.23 TRINITY_DN20364_c0_g1_i1:60-530(+)